MEVYSLRRICVLLLWDGVSCKCQLDPIDYLGHLCPYWPSAHCICQLLIEGVQGSNYNDSWCIHSSSQVCQLLLHVFWCSVTRYIYVRNVYVSLENRPLCHYVTLPLHLIIFLILKSALSEVGVAIPAFFWLMLAWFIFLHPFTLHPPVSVYLKWVSCIQHIVGSCVFF